MDGDLGDAIRRVFDERIVVGFADESENFVSHYYEPLGRQVLLVASSQASIADVCRNAVYLAATMLPERIKSKLRADHTEPHEVDSEAYISAARDVDRLFAEFPQTILYMCGVIDAEREAYDVLAGLSAPPLAFDTIVIKPRVPISALSESSVSDLQTLSTVVGNLH